MNSSHSTPHMSHALGGWRVGRVVGRALVGPGQFQLKGWKGKVNRLLLARRQETRENQTFLNVYGCSYDTKTTAFQGMLMNHFHISKFKSNPISVNDWKMTNELAHGDLINFLVNQFDPNVHSWQSWLLKRINVINPTTISCKRFIKSSRISKVASL